MDQLPVFFRIKDKTAAICGGGAVAARWAEAVLKRGAKARVFAEALGADLQVLRSTNAFEHVRRRPLTMDFADCFLVFSAMQESEADELICDLARKAQIPVTVAGRPDLSDFLMPATGAQTVPRRESEGEVYLVGAGPGDPDLLTFRAWKLMKRADAVLYDRLLPEGILDLVNPGAERFYVGKLAGDHVVPQEEITALMVRLAKEGKRVLRLKGGDPFTFGRGGEEIEGLTAEDIPFQVVPGITAAAGCAAYAGIPLTHRDHAQACIFVTGHARAGGGLSLDWSALIQPRQTVAIFMGLGQLRFLMDEYVKHGGDPNLPAAVVDNGTRPNQSVVTGSVATIAGFVEKAALKGPALTILGTVVSLRDKLKPVTDGSQSEPVLRSY